MNTSDDPFSVLGVPREACEAEIRARYLELVKQYPPDRKPEKFREIRAAFETVIDPLLMARRLIEPFGEEPPSWEAAIETQKERPPKLSPTFLLSLGNRNPNEIAPANPLPDSEKKK